MQEETCVPSLKIGFVTLQVHKSLNHSKKWLFDTELVPFKKEETLTFRWATLLFAISEISCKKKPVDQLFKKI